MDDQGTTGTGGNVNDSPLILTQEFAARLGWHGLCQYQHRLTRDICGSLPVGTVITCYATTDEKFFLQINENPVAQKRHYQASIVAERYGLPFTIDDRESAIAEAQRLSDVLSRSILRNPSSRREFIRAHLELVNERFVGRRAYRKLTGKNNLPTH
jgi:hypothetical protein